MFAIHLQNHLTRLIRDADMAPLDQNDMERRFQSLRNYGRLPIGRDQRDAALTDQQIASTIIGLAATAPGWAGHVSAVIARRFPVGGMDAAFYNAPTFLDALVKILSDEEARASILSVTISTGEGGVNSHGFASICYDADSGRKVAHYVPAEAVSLLRDGADVGFDRDQRYGLCFRDLILGKRFFQELVSEIDEARRVPRDLPPASPEYDAEEAARKRANRLGATRSSRFLNIGVDNHVTWPNEETLISFDRYKLVLMPKTREKVQSIHIDLHANRVTIEEARTVINRFLSLLTWCDDQFAVAQDGWSGNPVPVAVNKRDLAFATTRHWIFDRKIPESDDIKRALALYREGRNAEQNYMISYAVLSYFKVLEVRYSEGKKIKPWIAKNFQSILGNNPDNRMQCFLSACGAETVQDYLWTACRVAVAHVREKHPSDPDEAVELRRLDYAADVMRQLARHFISNELGVSDRPYEIAEPN